MQGIRPCPYCGGEVEVIRLRDDKERNQKQYRIECRKCHALVAKGLGFEKESEKESEKEARERIHQYEEFIGARMAPLNIRTNKRHEGTDVYE